MTVLVVVPIRSFRLGKTRLAAELPPQRRQELGAQLARTVISAIDGAGLRAAVVTADDEVAAWATDCQLRLVIDPGGGLDAACRAGVEAAGPSRWAVVHGDLPLVTTRDFEVIAHLVRAGRDVIAPSSDGGTTLLSARRPVEFAYGPASFHRHLLRLDNPVIVARRGLLHDLDTRADFDSARQAGAL